MCDIRASAEVRARGTHTELLRAGGQSSHPHG